ncbi:MAG: sigma-70 family RNA polymerase sigma factor [Chloroflexi bacterium]|nr:sigma-70 family RNA polymerase sigma factor [Chloroflexota bacterium]
MNPVDERHWVAQAAGDPAAFTRLYTHYFPRLYAYARYRVVETQEAEEVVAETFLKVVETLDRFQWRHNQSFAAWLFRIAHNVLIDRARRSGRVQIVPLADLPDLASRAILPDEAALRAEELATLRRLLATLSPRRQEIITLRFFGGLRNQEIAQVLEIDERTVAAHLCRGLEDLHRKYLDVSVETREGATHECAG